MGWDKDFIIAERMSHIGGKIDGWMVIEVKEKKISGPVSIDNIKSNKKLNSIKIYSAKEAWNVL